MYSDSTERSFAGALVFFLVMALSAYVLLVTALVFWLAELLGSLPLAAVLLGGFTLLIALLTYQLAVRDAIARLRERWEVVYEVMRTVHDGCRDSFTGSCGKAPRRHATENAGLYRQSGVFGLYTAA